MTRRRFLALSSEAVRSALAQPIATLATVIMIAGMCAAVLLTNGRAVAAENAILATIDDVGTRTIIVRAKNDSGLESDVVARLSRVDAVAWVGGFSSARDVENRAFGGGERMPLRDMWSEDLSALGVALPPGGVGATAWLSSVSLERLGFEHPAGAVRTLMGDRVYSVVGEIDRPSYLSFLDPLAVSPKTTIERGPISVLVVVAARPDLVEPLAAIVKSAMAGVDPQKVTIETSQQLADLRSLVKGQLGDSGRSLVLVVFAATAVLVGAVLFGFVMLRRKDFGRRRALGASQSLILVLLLMQTSMVAAAGAVLGSTIAVATMGAIGDPLPQPGYVLSLAIIAILIGAVASVLPAVAAARREPIHELRVP